MKQDTQREQFLLDIERIKQAIQITESPYLKRDYQKALKRKYRELKQYDRLHQEVKNTDASRS